MVKRTRKLLVTCLAVPLAVGGISAFITRGSMSVFGHLKKPPLSPPGWLFPIVWTILFILMGFASYLVAATDYTRQRTRALAVYITQLAVNFFWPVFFFKGKWYLFSFFWLILLWGLIAACIRSFYAISKKAAWLLIPYLIWVTYAGYLNLFIYLLN